MVFAAIRACITLMTAANEASEDVAADWQNLGLEQDVLFQIFENVGSAGTIQLSGVSSGWRDIINTVCGTWSNLEITARQSQTDSFAAWVVKCGISIRHLKISTSGGQQSWYSTKGVQGDYLPNMTGLEGYINVAGASMESLNQLPSSISTIEAKFVVPADILDPRIDLGTLSLITKLSLDCQTVSKRHTNVYLQLPNTNPLERLTLTSYGFSRVDFCLLHSASFQALRFLHLSFISTQTQLEQIMQMVTLESMHVGIDTDRSALGDGIDITGIQALVNLRQLHLCLHTCYLRNAHMLQRLPQLRTLGIDMSDDVAVLFRPEDGSRFALACLLNHLEHVELVMHSVFDVTDCLEGLGLVSRLPSLRVVLQQSLSNGPSEVHWAIKDGSVLARAMHLRHLHVECTSMLINLLPPRLESLHITAKKINVKTDLRSALSSLAICHLKARLDVEYF